MQDAQKLAVAAQIGNMSLALRRAGQADVTPVRTVQIADLQSNGPRAPGGGLSDRPRLIAVSHRRGTALPLVIHTRSVIVVHGDAATPVEVPAERYGAGA